MDAGLILQHEEGAPPALFGDWCTRRGVGYRVQRVWEKGVPAVPNTPWICSLGSRHEPGATRSPTWVADEVAFLRTALEKDVPILGICFGGQALAAAAGARISPSLPPEVGWRVVETYDSVRIPEGPWLHFHFHQLSVPQHAAELARSEAGPAAFALGRSLGVQFHPEGTTELARDWSRLEENRLSSLGIDTSALEIDGSRRDHAAAAAMRLFDRWWLRAFRCCP